MKTPVHMIVAAIGAGLPDVMLATFAWRKKWIPDTHPLVRIHRYIHSTRGLLTVFFLAWASHVFTDFFVTHNTKDTWNE